MFRNCMKLSLALGALCLTCIGTANAASPVQELHMAPIALPVVDEGTAIEEEERPNEVAPGYEKKGEPAHEEAQPKSDGDDAELDEVEREFPTEKLPPSMEK
jgi:hypothetical protein